MRRICLLGLLAVLANSNCNSYAQVAPQPEQAQHSGPQSTQESAPRLRSIHLVGSGIVVIQQAFHAFGIDSAFANLTPSSTRPIEVNLDDTDIATPGDVLLAITHF